MNTPTAAVQGPMDLDDLETGTSVRFMTANGPGIALKNNDRTWSALGAGAKLTSAELWEAAASIIILGTPPRWAGNHPAGARTQPL